MGQKRVLITGGAGFIGSHLCDLFIQKGWAVVCVDNLLTGTKENVRHLLRQRRFSFIRQDLSKPIRVPGPVASILHFASPASPPDYLKYPIETLKVGALGTYHLLETAKEKKAKFLLASTSEVYGDPLVRPQGESYWGNVNPVGPRSVYDEAKRFAEALTSAYRRKHRVNTRIVRIFNTYGERMRPEDGRVIPNFIAQALSGMPLTVYGEGRQTRSYCYISDLLRGIEKALESDFHDPVNLGNPNEMTVLKLAKLILKLTASKSHVVFRPLPADDPKQRCPDIRLAKKVLNWAPQVRLEQGLRAAIRYFREKSSFER